MQDELRNSIAEQLGIADLPPEEQDKLIASFGEVALKAATVAMLEKLPEGKRDAFATLAEAREPAALSAFLDAEVPGHEAIAAAAVAEEFKRFKESALV